LFNKKIIYIGKLIYHLPLFAQQNFETKILLFDVYVFRAAGSSRRGTDRKCLPKFDRCLA